MSELLTRGACTCLLTLAMCLPAVAQGTEVRPLACGAYRAVPGGTSSSGHATRLSLQKGGRLLFEVSDWSITQVDCRDLDNDGVPELLVASHSGGAHCCTTLRVWTLAASPAPLLSFDAGNAAEFEVLDPAPDGRRALLLGDDAFAYFNDLPYSDSPSHLPLVACLTGGRFEDCTRRFPDVLRRAAKRYTDRLKPPASAEQVPAVEGAALGLLAVSVLLGEEERGMDTVRRLTSSDAVVAWLTRARPHVQQWARARSRKLKGAEGREQATTPSAQGRPSWSPDRLQPQAARLRP